MKKASPSDVYNALYEIRDYIEITVPPIKKPNGLVNEYVGAIYKRVNYYFWTSDGHPHYISIARPVDKNALKQFYNLEELKRITEDLFEINKVHYKCRICRNNFTGSFCSVCTTRIESKDHPKKMRDIEISREMDWLGDHSNTGTIERDALILRKAELLQEWNRRKLLGY
jgi:hypothetical protein